MKTALTFLGVFLCTALLFISNKDSISYAPDSKIKGMHAFGRGEWSDGLARIDSTNIEWLAHVPYAYQKDAKTKSIRYAKKDSLGRWSRRDSMWFERIESAKTYGMKGIMKPHLWMSNAGADEWRNAINFDNEADWKEWEDNYHKLIMHYVELAIETNMDMFCIGVEMRSTVRSREVFWRKLIADIREVYDGQLTYGANWWEEYQEVPFWDALDYIGVQAYFPLSDIDNPNIEQLKNGWQPYYRDLKSFSEKNQKPILFTEIGYRNTADTAIRPWEWPEHLDEKDITFSDSTQYHCYEAFFQTFWEEDWFAGALFWQWRMPDSRSRRQRFITFSPMDKLAEESLSEWYK